MEKRPIKVFARLKTLYPPQNDQIYEIIRKHDFHEIVFNKLEENIDLETNKTKQVKYRFQQIFENASQKEIFDFVAKPVIQSVLKGYNGTIFAYGQTGSGKTYSIRGSPEDSENKGIIPRSIEHIFDYIKKAGTVYSVFISYMEIYNEIAYDLLKNIVTMEELPRVILLEDSEGNVNLRNLRIEPVTSQKEAMKLLKLGEKNRKITETPTNPRSSRSHCVFTIYISNYNQGDSKIQRSKIHLVDLAGSERVYKSALSGNILMDALHINLSLHFLEQVILALSEPKRAHIPYRNSVMTTVLRDSLGGNCLTAMLATFTADARYIHESISTCRFAQRVAMIKTELSLEDETDPLIEITNLKMEVECLRKQLALMQNNVWDLNDKHLSSEEIGDCKIQLKKFVVSCSLSDLEINDSRKTKVYLESLREMAVLNFKANNRSNKEHKEKNTISTSDKKTKNKNGGFLEKELIFLTSNMSIEEKEAFKLVTNDPKNIKEINVYLSELKQKYDQVKTIAERTEQCKQNVVILKKRIDGCSGFDQEGKLAFEKKLKVQECIYNESVVQLQRIKTETDKIKQNIERAKSKLLEKSNDIAKRLKIDMENKQNCLITEKNIFHETPATSNAAKLEISNKNINTLEECNTNKIITEIFDESCLRKNTLQKGQTDYPEKLESQSNLSSMKNDLKLDKKHLINNSPNICTLTQTNSAYNSDLQSQFHQQINYNSQHCELPSIVPREYNPKNPGIELTNNYHYVHNDYPYSANINPYSQGLFISQRPYSSQNNIHKIPSNMNSSSQNINRLSLMPSNPINAADFQRDYYGIQRYNQYKEQGISTKSYSNVKEELKKLLDDSDTKNQPAFLPNQGDFNRQNYYLNNSQMNRANQNQIQYIHNENKYNQYDNRTQSHMDSRAQNSIDWKRACVETHVQNEHYGQPNSYQLPNGQPNSYHLPNINQINDFGNHSLVGDPYVQNNQNYWEQNQHFPPPNQTNIPSFSNTSDRKEEQMQHRSSDNGYKSSTPNGLITDQPSIPVESYTQKNINEINIINNNHLKQTQHSTKPVSNSNSDMTSKNTENSNDIKISINNNKDSKDSDEIDDSNKECYFDNIPLTGDPDVDAEIIAFYKARE